jgi:hypothetical protein
LYFAHEVALRFMHQELCGASTFPRQIFFANANRAAIPILIQLARKTAGQTSAVPLPHTFHPAALLRTKRDASLVPGPAGTISAHFTTTER